MKKMMIKIYLILFNCLSALDWMMVTKRLCRSNPISITPYQRLLRALALSSFALIWHKCHLKPVSQVPRH